MTRRTDRVAEAIRRLTSEIIQNDLKDPRVSGFITITKAEITPDLRYAKIYYSVLAEEKMKKKVAYGLRSAKSYIRMRIADELKLRYATDIVFIVDEEMEKAARIDKILEKIHKDEEKNDSNRKDSRPASAARIVTNIPMMLAPLGSVLIRTSISPSI